jgi:Asp/Glu/hydantoin racemase
MRHMQERLLHPRCTSDRPLSLSIGKVGAGAETFERMIDISRQVRNEDGADTTIMGCAGMTRHRMLPEGRRDLPVINPTQTATNITISTLAVAAR